MDGEPNGAALVLEGAEDGVLDGVESEGVERVAVGRVPLLDGGDEAADALLHDVGKREGGGHLREGGEVGAVGLAGDGGDEPQPFDSYGVAGFHDGVPVGGRVGLDVVDGVEDGRLGAVDLAKGLARGVERGDGARCFDEDGVWAGAGAGATRSGGATHGGAGRG